MKGGTLTGIGGTYQLESVAHFDWNECHTSIGISGTLGLDYAHLTKFFRWILKTNKLQCKVGLPGGDLQNVINPYNLAIRTMRDSSIFSVGGSISVNAHGEDFRAGSLNNSVVGFHLILANGKKYLFHAPAIQIYGKLYLVVMVYWYANSYH